jgi:glycosyltransferase involved in cell wall biosynthesis
MRQARVSVVVPAYNAAKTLARALGSIAAQTRAPDEVIVVDDASSDDTAAVAEAHPLRPTVLRLPKNRGAGGALHDGLEAARHDWVAILDADDEWLPEKLAAQVAALDEEPQAAVVATGFVFVDRHGQDAWDYGVAPFPHTGREFWRNLLVDSAILQSSAMVRRRLALATGGVDATRRTGSDQHLFFRLAAMAPVAYVHRRLVRYHDSPGSLTKVPERDDILSVLAMHERHVAMFRERLTAEERREARRRRHAEAATGLLAARAWGPALQCLGVAFRNGEPVGPWVRKVTAHLPLVRNVKKIVIPAKAGAQQVRPTGSPLSRG